MKLSLTQTTFSTDNPARTPGAERTRSKQQERLQVHTVKTVKEGDTMNAFKKSVSPLAKVFCDIKYTGDGKLSISGNMPNGGGQINTMLREIPEEEREYMPGWDAETFNRFLDVWDEWHLNDMRAGCEHQRAEKWENKRIDPVEVPGVIANRDERGVLAIWVRKSEHPEGLLCEPCPVCGYKYGSAWLKEEVPEDVLSFLVSLPDSGIDPGDSYNEQAEKFLAKTGATITAEHKETAKYFDDDKETRDIYQITITRGTRSYSFPFGQSINNSGKYHAINIYGKNQNNGNTVFPPTWEPPMVNRGGDPLKKGMDYKKNPNFSAPSAYDVLAAIQKNDPGTFHDFCMDFGYDEDSRRAEKTYEAVKEEYTQLSRLFTDSELEEMQEIN
ncbi:MAG: hypothetical protein NUV49_04215 [Patescibacteria group bacterium]|nr:hypothetical protein [Patescibacteria group bacterium]